MSITEPIYERGETEESAIERVKYLYVQGVITLHDFEFRVGVILGARLA